MRTFALTFAFLILFLGGVVHYFLIDGALPKNSKYDLDLDAVRELAASPKEELPTEIRMEMLAGTTVPYIALRAGGSFRDAIMARATFQIITPDGDYVLEAGMDRALAKEYDQEEGFDDQVWENIQDLLSRSKGILVTHEHPDHIGAIVRHRNPASLVDKLYLTKEQFDGLSAFASGGQLPEAFKDYSPIDIEEPLRIAPGIVMIRAEGHTPGSVLFYVKLQSGREFLFVGDVAYSASNIRDAVDRPRLVRFFMVSKEDRNALVHQLRAFHELSIKEPDVIMVPSHADDVLKNLAQQRIIKEGFSPAQ